MGSPGLAWDPVLARIVIGILAGSGGPLLPMADPNPCIPDQRKGDTPACDVHVGACGKLRSCNYMVGVLWCGGCVKVSGRGRMGRSGPDLYTIPHPPIPNTPRTVAISAPILHSARFAFAACLKPFSFCI